MVDPRATRAEEPTETGDGTRDGGPIVAWDRKLEAILEQWRRRAWASQVAHYRVASRLRIQHRALGLPVVIFTTAVGTSIFATLNDSSESVGFWPRVIVGTISVGACGPRWPVSSGSTSRRERW